MDNNNRTRRTRREQAPNRGASLSFREKKTHLGEKQGSVAKACHPKQRTRPKQRRATGRPPPNPGGYGPFPIYPCQAPNGGTPGKLWTTTNLSTGHYQSDSEDSGSASRSQVRPRPASSPSSNGAAKCRATPVR